MLGEKRYRTSSDRISGKQVTILLGTCDATEKGTGFDLPRILGHFSYSCPSRLSECGPFMAEARYFRPKQFR
jgi:hypothetical protein